MSFRCVALTQQTVEKNRLLIRDPRLRQVEVSTFFLGFGAKKSLDSFLGDFCARSRPNMSSATLGRWRSWKLRTMGLGLGNEAKCSCLELVICQALGGLDPKRSPWIPSASALALHRERPDRWICGDRNGRIGRP